MNSKDVQPIHEQQDENGEDLDPNQMVMFDDDGNPIELTHEQMLMIDALNKQKNNTNMTDEQEKMLKSINLEDL